jgi:hypothetical protein
MLRADRLSGEVLKSLVCLSVIWKIRERRSHDPNLALSDTRKKNLKNKIEALNVKSSLNFLTVEFSKSK